MFDVRQRLIVLAVAALLDIIIGDPHWLWHPVMGIGRVIAYMERLIKKRTAFAGVILAFCVIVVSVGVPALLLFGAYQIHPIVATVLECIMAYQLLAMHSLYSESMKVHKALKNKDVEGARYAVSMIVGRDTAALDEAGIAKAAVETVAENTSDGVVAPLIHIFLFGALGGFFYKAVNTMDSMIGYKNDKYRYLGTAAAKLDDVVNFIPARISALAMILASFILRMDTKNAWKIYRRDHANHDSPNSAQTESVCAGALDLQLAGPAYYFGKRKEKPTIGDLIREIEYEDIKRANWLMIFTSAIVFLVGITTYLGIWLL